MSVLDYSHQSEFSHHNDTSVSRDNEGSIVLNIDLSDSDLETMPKTTRTSNNKSLNRKLFDSYFGDFHYAFQKLNTIFI